MLNSFIKYKKNIFLCGAVSLPLGICPVMADTRKINYPGQIEVAGRRCLVKAQRKKTSITNYLVHQDGDEALGQQPITQQIIRKL